MAAVCGWLALAAPTAQAGTANAGLRGASASNPLAGISWGIYTGPYYSSAYPYYETATGRDRQLLARIALEPQAFWFGDWYANDEIQSEVAQFIATTTGGNPNVMSQLTVFRLDPWEGDACPGGSWNAGDQSSYTAWIDGLAAGIGASRVAVILQPDMPFAVCAPSSVPLALVSYAARKLSALPHATVYIDAGARYWPAFSQVAGMLERAGIRHVRGFALNNTEYDSTSAELEYGARIVHALAANGVTGTHFVINTAENGAPFLNGQYSGDVENPRVCHDTGDTLCATLGIPPTADVAAPRWGLAPHDRTIARQDCDAYVWVGRPWLDDGSYPFDLPRALGLAASTPW